MSVKVVEVKPNAKVTVTPKQGTLCAPAVVTVVPTTPFNHVSLSYEVDGVAGVLATLTPVMTTVTLPSSLFSKDSFSLSVADKIAVSVTIVTKSVSEKQAVEAPVITVGGAETVSKKRKAEEALEAPIAESKPEPKAEKSKKADKKAEKVAEKAVEKAEEKPVEKPAEKKAKKEEVPIKPNEPVKFANGLTYKDEEIGDGVEVKKGRRVGIRYQGMLTNGKIFDSNMPRGQLLEFTVGKGEVIAGMELAMIGMKRGGKRRMIIPPNATLIFDVQLDKLY